MPDPHALLVFLAAALALNVTPGPDMLYVVARSTGEGRRAGIASALGIGAGTLVHIAALALGLSALLATMPLAYDAIRWAGAAYLVWLGVGAIRGARRAGPAVVVERAPLGRVFRQGVVTNVLNPKVALFFLAFLPQFVDPARGSPVRQIVTLGLLFDLSGTLVNHAVAVGASGAAAWLQARRGGRSARGVVLLRRATGLMFIALGVRLALAAGR
jgi:threonine/homoserine/homoserine lactone efflux protein